MTQRSDYARPRPYAELDQALHTLGGYALLVLVNIDFEGLHPYGQNMVIAVTHTSSLSCFLLRASASSRLASFSRNLQKTSVSAAYTSHPILQANHLSDTSPSYKPSQEMIKLPNPPSSLSPQYSVWHLLCVLPCVRLTLSNSTRRPGHKPLTSL